MKKCKGRKTRRMPELRLTIKDCKRKNKLEFKKRSRKGFKGKKRRGLRKKKCKERNWKSN